MRMKKVWIYFTVTQDIHVIFLVRFVNKCGFFINQISPWAWYISFIFPAEEGVPLSTVVKVVKHAYNYEQWDTFDNMVEPALAAVREADDPKYAADEKALELLMVSWIGTSPDFSRVRRCPYVLTLFEIEENIFISKIISASTCHFSS